jgi:hypothetical protein
MKIFILFILTSLFTTVNGQYVNNKMLLDSAKKLFKSEQNLSQEEFEKFDYSKIATILENIIKTNPENIEARYFLGYTFSRINSRDGRGMANMSLDLVKKASEQFEYINKISPKYTGEIIILDPYSKITSEWGSLAMSYRQKNKLDSSLWAFNEAKKRGGFGDFFLLLNRAVLDLCSKNSILITSGDSYTIPLWYLQAIEGYRKDVSIIDASLLNSEWYPNFVAKNENVKFDLPQEVIDTIEYCLWKDSSIAISGFTWTVFPSFYKKFLLRGDRILLSILKENNFKRDIYFTSPFPEASQLSLINYLQPMLLVDKVNVSNQMNYDHEKYKAEIIKTLLLFEKINTKSHEEVNTIDVYRYSILLKINELILFKKMNEAKELMSEMDKYASEKKYPYQSKVTKEFRYKTQKAMSKIR